MYILSKDGKRFINFDNVASMYIHEITFHHLTRCEDEKYWQIRAMYPAVSNDILWDKLDEFKTEEECKNAFNKLCFRIATGSKYEVIDMNDL